MKNFITSLVILILVGLATQYLYAADGVQVLKEKKIRNAVSQFIMERTSGSTMEIKVKRIGYSGDLSVPSGKVSFEIIAPQQWEGWGKTVLGMLVRIDDHLVRNLSIPVEVEALTDMVVALRPIGRGEVIGVSDVALQKWDLASVIGPICFDPMEVVGKRARIPIRGNIPVRGDYLEKVPIVKYGQPVMIVAESGDLRVTAAGMARGTGAEGDMIMVQNLNSRKNIQGRIIDAGTILVNF